jgi:hypothetical protein
LYFDQYCLCQYYLHFVMHFVNMDQDVVNLRASYLLNVSMVIISTYVNKPNGKIIWALLMSYQDTNIFFSVRKGQALFNRSRNKNNCISRFSDYQIKIRVCIILSWIGNLTWLVSSATARRSSSGSSQPQLLCSH